MKNSIKKHYHSHKETIRNLIWRTIQIVGKQGITFLIFILCAKLLTPYNFGIYNYTLTIIFFLIMFGDFGISTATSKYVAEYNLVDKNKLKAVLFNFTLIIASLSIFISLLTLIFGQWYLKERYIYVAWLLPLVFLAPLTSLYDGIYRGLKKFKQLAIISLLIGLLSILIVYFFIESYGLIGAIISQNIFYIILLLGLSIGYREFHFQFNKTVIKEIGKYSLTYGIAIVGNYLFIRFGILILGHYNYIEELATYELINKIFTILLLPFFLLGQVVAPNFSELAARKKYEKIHSKAVKYTIIFFWTGILGGIVLYFILPIVFHIFFPEYIAKSYFASTFLLCLMTYVFNVWATTFDAGILIPTGHAKLMAIFYVLLGFFGVILSFLLINYFGFLGGVSSFTISSFVMAVGLRITYFNIKSYYNTSDV